MDLRVRPRVPHALRSGKKTVSVPNETELFRVQEELFRVQEELFRVQKELFRVQKQLFRVQKELFRVQKELFRVQKETRPAQGNKSCGMREKRPKVLEKGDLQH